jgi:hypothetical protein
LVDRLAILVVARRFMAWVPLTLVPCVLTVMSVCNILFVGLLLFRFGVSWGMCDVNSCNVLLLLFMALWAPISATLFRRAVLMLWHAFCGLLCFSVYLFFVRSYIILIKVRSSELGTGTR